MLFSAVFASENPSTLSVGRTLPDRGDGENLAAAHRRHRTLRGALHQGESGRQPQHAATPRPTRRSRSASRSSGRSSERATGPIRPPCSADGSEDCVRAIASKLEPAWISGEQRLGTFRRTDDDQPERDLRVGGRLRMDQREGAHHRDSHRRQYPTYAPELI